MAFMALAFMFGLVSAAPAAAVTGSPVGYGERATGGQGGPTVRASTGTEIHEALCSRADDDSPIVIEVEGTFTVGNTSEVSGDSCNTVDGVIEIKEVSNVSIIGVGDGATFDQVGIHIRESSNIIIQNVTVQNVKKSGSPISNDGDAIGIERNVSRVWIDHVTLEASGGEDDGYDSLVDIKDNVENVTVSYSVFRNAGHAGLVGSNEDDTTNDNITFHHNWYDNIDSRAHLIRGARAHMYNNFFEGIVKSGINSRAGASVLVENNYFKDSNSVLGTFYTDQTGTWEANGNILDNVTWNEDATQEAGPSMDSTGSVSVSYDYDLDDASCVPDLVRSLAGANQGNRSSNGTCEGFGRAIFVAPDGSEGGSGTIDDPTTLESAIELVEPGGVIYLRGGTYDYETQVRINIGNDGSERNRKNLRAYLHETPILNFSAMVEASSNRGLTVNGDFWHVHGIIVEWAGDNGIFVGGNNNIIERTITRFNRDTGLQIARAVAGGARETWPVNNLVLSAISHDNRDSDGEDADGFAAKLTVGDGNVFRYSVAHNNVDDGWDLYTRASDGPIGIVTIEDSLAYDNGFLSDGSSELDGDKNGFKLGGSDIAVDHIIRNNVAWRNGKDGFTYNRNLGSIAFSNNVSIDSARRNYNFQGGTSQFSGNTSCFFIEPGTRDRTIGVEVGSNNFYTDVNSDECSQYEGELSWEIDSDGVLQMSFD